MNDNEWLATLKSRLEQREINGIDFSGFPPEDIQMMWTGIAGKRGVELSYQFYTEIRRMQESFNLRLSHDFRILDFGCGWGRNS